MLVALLALLVARGVAAAPACGPELDAFLARCAAETREPARVRACSPRVVVAVGAGDDPLLVELRAPGAFRDAGPVGLQPVGEFSDWSAVPEATRARLDGLEWCLRAHPVELDHGPLARVASPHHLPWLLFAGAAVIAWLARSRPRRDLLGGLVTFVGALGVRALVVAPEFFHQNGQGPLWVQAAAARAETWPYGPGFIELFGVLASSPDGDLRVFHAAMALGAAAVPLAIGVARHAGAGWPAAFALGAVVAVDPVLARLSSSESYWGVITALLMGATWLVGEGVRRDKIARAVAWAGAGLLVAQAARVHPAAWVPSSLVVLAAAFVTSPERARLRRVLAAALVVGLVAAPFVLGTMRSVLEGTLGSQWAPSVPLATTPWTRGAVLGFVLVALLSRGHVDRVRAAAGLALVVAVLDVTCVVRTDSAVVVHAHVRTFLAPMVAALAWASASLPLRAGPLVAVPLAVLGLAGLRPARAIPADAREAELLRRHRATLPSSSRVCFVSRADRRVTALPLFDPRGPRLVALEPAAAAAACTHYVRTSLCSSPEGREACARVARALTLRLVDELTLPAIPSLPWLPYDVPTITVSLHEVVPEVRRPD